MKFRYILSRIVLVAVLVIVAFTGCPIFTIFRVPCPCCGVTRAWVAALSGKVGLAFQYHALFPIIPAVGLLYLLREKISPAFIHKVDIMLIVMASLIFAYAVLRWLGFVSIP